MRYLVTILLSSMLLACTTTSGRSGASETSADVVKSIASQSMTYDDLKTDDDKLSYQMGVQYIQRNEFYAAEERLLPLIKKYPGFGELYVLLGLAQEKQGKVSDAAVLYSKAISQNPNDRVAIKRYAQLQCDPTDKNSPAKLANIADHAAVSIKAGLSSGASACYLENGDNQKAYEYAQKAIMANPNYGDSYYFLAYSAFNLKKYNEVFSALNHYHDAYGYDPQSVRLGLNAARRSNNQVEISKYEGILMNRGE